MENRLAFFAGAATAQAPDNLVQGQFIVHHGAERNLLLLHQLFQGLGLAQRAGKSVEDETAAIEDAGAALAHHLPHGGVRHQFATTHILQCCLHRRGLIAVFPLPRSSKDVSGREMASIQTPRQEFGLGTFAYTRRPQEDQPPGVLVFSWDG